MSDPIKNIFPALISSRPHIPKVTNLIPSQPAKGVKCIKPINYRAKNLAITKTLQIHCLF